MGRGNTSSPRIKKEDIKLIKSIDRFIISELKKEDKILIIINTYSPCDDREKSKFLDILSNEILSVKIPQMKSFAWEISTPSSTTH